MNINELIPLIRSKDYNDICLAASIFENNFMSDKWYIPHLLYFAEYTFYIGTDNNIDNCFTQLLKKIPYGGNISILYMGGGIWIRDWSITKNLPKNIDWFPNGNFNNSLLEHIKLILIEYSL